MAVAMRSQHWAVHVSWHLPMLMSSAFAWLHGAVELVGEDVHPACLWLYMGEPCVQAGMATRRGWFCGRACEDVHPLQSLLAVCWWPICMACACACGRAFMIF